MSSFEKETQSEQTLQLDFSEEQIVHLLAFLGRVEFQGEEALHIARLMELIQNNPNNTWLASDINNLMVALRKTSGIGVEAIAWTELYVRLSDAIKPTVPNVIDMKVDKDK